MNTLVGIMLIVAGLGWIVLACMASWMAARSVDFWKDIGKPASPGVIAILLGIALLCSGCEPYAQLNGAVGVETGKTNDVRQVDVDFDGTIKADIPGV